MPTTFRTTRRVEFVDTDMAGIVHFSNFFRYMEAAEVAFLRERGLSVKLEWEGQKLALPRVSAACDFMRPVRFEDVLEIVVTLEKIGRASLSYSHEFFKEGEPVAKGRVTCVCCLADGGELKAVPLPDELRRKLES